MPADLDDVTADAVRQLGLAADDPELRARLLDISWERLRDAEAAREAVRSYIDAANRLFDPRHWIDYVHRAERAVRLARLLQDQALSDTVLTDMEQKIIELDGSDPSFMTARLMELLHEFRKGDPEQMTQIARKAAKAAEDQNDFERMRSHLENLRRWRRRAGDDDGEREAKTAIAHHTNSKPVFIQPRAGKCWPLSGWKRPTNLTAIFRACAGRLTRFTNACVPRNKPPAA